jgi:hypothetical protein
MASPRKLPIIDQINDFMAKKQYMAVIDLTRYFKDYCPKVMAQIYSLRGDAYSEMGNYDSAQMEYRLAESFEKKIKNEEKVLPSSPIKDQLYAAAEKEYEKQYVYLIKS